MNLDLGNKVAIVTGGTRGIGRACVEAFLSDGSRVVAVGRDVSPLDDLSGAHRETLYPLALDLTDRESARSMVDATVERLGRVDVLVNCAGAVPKVDLRSSRKEWEVAFGHKFQIYIDTMSAVVPHMRQAKRGAVVNIVGTDGVRPLPWNLAAVANNAALLAVSRALAHEFVCDGIRINCVNPGPTATRRWEYVITTAAEYWQVERAQAQELLMQSMPLGRLVSPGEVASLVLLLASDAVANIIGESIAIDGFQRRDQLAGVLPSPVAVAIPGNSQG